MGYYSYHGRIKSRIDKGELIAVIPADKPNYAVIMIFSTPPHTRPIKVEALERYADYSLENYPSEPAPLD